MLILEILVVVFLSRLIWSVFSESCQAKGQTKTDSVRHFVSVTLGWVLIFGAIAGVSLLLLTLYYLHLNQNTFVR